MASAVDKLSWKLMGPMTATAAATADTKVCGEGLQGRHG